MDRKIFLSALQKTIATLFIGAILAPHAVAESRLTAIAALVTTVRAASYPELNNASITIEELRSESVYLETRFTFTSYFSTGHLRYMIFFNEEAAKRRVPAEGLRAIMAHELAHIDYYESESRMGLARLVRLLSPSFNMRFERRADIKAIALGYGPGLQTYRSWLYRNIPSASIPEKTRDYFTPEEIGLILRIRARRADFTNAMMRCVPRNAREIEELARGAHVDCAE